MTFKNRQKTDKKTAKKTENRHTENGNALWFILIAVVLLGLLTMILSRGGSSSEQTGDIEQLRVQASEIMRFAKSLESAVQEMQLRNISENDISFENSISTTDYTNPNCDEDSDRSHPSCLIFDAEGAGLSYKSPNARWLDSTNASEIYYGDWLFTGDVCIPEAQDTSGAECSSNYSRNSELMVILPYINLKLCQQINKLVDAPISTGNPPQDDAFTWSLAANFTGTIGGNSRTLGDLPLVDIHATHTGCFEGGNIPAPSTYHFYHVLKAR